MSAGSGPRVFQTVPEGVALAAFGMIRDFTEHPLPRSLNAYVMKDEARHVAFVLLALQDAYRDLTAAEKAEREELNLFSRVVPIVKRTGLWGDKVQRAFEDMGVIAFQDMEPVELFENDERIAADLEAEIAAMS